MKAAFWVCFLLFMASVRSQLPGPTLVPGVLILAIIIGIIHLRGNLTKHQQSGHEGRKYPHSSCD